MSTSTKTSHSIRQGGPGAARENAQAPLEIRKPPPGAGESYKGGAQADRKKRGR